MQSTLDTERQRANLDLLVSWLPLIEQNIHKFNHETHVVAVAVVKFYNEFQLKPFILCKLTHQIVQPYSSARRPTTTMVSSWKEPMT